MASYFTKMKLAIISHLPQPISGEWLYLHSNKIEIVKTINEADYIIFESNGDPVQLIEHIKSNYPKHKLVFILSGDTNTHIDNECIWLSNAIKPEGLALKQTQIFVTNPAIFKYYDIYLKHMNTNITNTTHTTHTTNTTLDNPLSEVNNLIHKYDIYFKGTIWDGMRTDMYNLFVNKPNCKIIKNNNYWKWRCESPIKPTQLELEQTAYDSYSEIIHSRLCLCPKGNGNSSMRIIEAIACGSIPILINDFSAPFGIPWCSINNISTDSIGLSFNTKIHSWDEIYFECMKLINDSKLYNDMKKKGSEYFINTIYSDSKIEGFKTYNNIDTVAFGFSNLIINKLYDIHCKK